MPQKTPTQSFIGPSEVS